MCNCSVHRHRGAPAGDQQARGLGLLGEVVEVAKKYAHRIDRKRVPAVSAWTKDIATRVEKDPEGNRLKSVS